MSKKKARKNNSNIQQENLEIKDNSVVLEKEETSAEDVKEQKAAFKSEKIKVVETKKKKVVETKNEKEKKKQKEKKPNIFVRMGKGMKSTASELKRVTWSKPKEVFTNSLVVLIVVLLFFLILLLMDYVLVGLFSLIVKGQWTHFFL